MCIRDRVGSVVSNLENDVLRMHILANSDSEEDQRLKLKAVSYTHLPGRVLDNKAEASSPLTGFLED